MASGAAKNVAHSYHNHHHHFKILITALEKKTQNKQMLLQAITAWNHCSTK